MRTQKQLYGNDSPGRDIDWNIYVTFWGFNLIFSSALWAFNSHYHLLSIKVNGNSAERRSYARLSATTALLPIADGFWLLRSHPAGALPVNGSLSSWLHCKRFLGVNRRDRSDFRFRAACKDKNFSEPTSSYLVYEINCINWWYAMPFTALGDN